MALDERQIEAETKEIEKIPGVQTKHFRKVCKGWDYAETIES